MFEQLNDISVNVYDLNEDKEYILHFTQKRRKRHVNL